MRPCMMAILKFHSTILCVLVHSVGLSLKPRFTPAITSGISDRKAKSTFLSFLPNKFRRIYYFIF